MIEIERKFLVANDSFKNEATSSSIIIQGFLNRDANRTVRVRISGEKGFLTIKGKSNKKGTTRFEWEKEIALSEAKALLAICEEGIINKVRYYVPYEEFIFEVDEFLDDNNPLILAEIELKHENDHFPRPKWLGKEVTGDVRYYNSYLSQCPFTHWK